MDHINQPWILPLAAVAIAAIAGVLRIYSRLLILETKFEDHKSREADARLKSIDEGLKNAQPLPAKREG